MNLGTAGQIQPLRACTTFTDFRQVLNGSKEIVDGELIALGGNIESVQPKVIAWAEHWIEHDTELNTGNSIVLVILHRAQLQK
jgi:hypothetical protein